MNQQLFNLNSQNIFQLLSTEFQKLQVRILVGLRSAIANWFITSTIVQLPGLPLPITTFNEDLVEGLLPNYDDVHNKSKANSIWDSRTIMDDYRQMMKEFSFLFLNCFMYGIKVVFQELQVVHAKSHVDTIKNWSKLIKKYIETHLRIWDAVFLERIVLNEL